MEQSVYLKIKGIVGVSSAFSQGGSWRITLPKEIVEKYEMEKDEKKRDFIFLETDKGVLMVAMDRVITPETLKSALR